MIDLHGWQVAAVVLGCIIAVRLLLAPYWIWKADQERLDALDNQITAGVKNEDQQAAKAAAIDEIAEEITWAVNNLVNPAHFDVLGFVPFVQMWGHPKLACK